jgi:hypothetical protein
VAQGPTAQVLDSAGVRIVTYDLTDLTVPTYRVIVEHDLEIGVQDGAPEYSFSRIPGLAVTRDGSFVVSDALAQELRVYDATGTYVRTIGQRGEGPGEFASAPAIVGLAGDTVFVFDRRSRRVTSFLMSGDLIEMTTLRSDVIADSGDIWVALTEYDGSEGYDWLVFSPAGELLGTVHTPPDTRLLAVHDDFVVGVVLDEFDVPYVRRHALLSSSEGGT